VCEVGAERIFDGVWIIALDMLPCFACLAEYRVSIIVSEVADTLDGVGLFVYSLLLSSNISIWDGARKRERRLTRKRDRRGQRRQLVCHNPDNSLAAAE
jgi:hypothetical protein